MSCHLLVFRTSRFDNFATFHEPSHTGDYKYKCDAGNGCTFKSTRDGERDVKVREFMSVFPLTLSRPDRAEASINTSLSSAPQRLS